jgi:DNA helicase-2/ATP-dependent DNA helicase PcrA
LGDRNQGLFLQNYNDKFEGDIITLNNSYRSSKQIFDFLNKIIDNKGINTVNRIGKEVEILEFDSENNMIDRLVEEIKNYKGKSLGIVTKSFKDSKKLYNKLKDKCMVNMLNYNGKDIKRGIVIGCIFLTKGLEFEKVIVVDASDNNYNSVIDTNYLYIACSRAMHELSLYSVGELSKLIK